jgi:hypothetical protein
MIARKMIFLLVTIVAFLVFLDIKSMGAADADNPQSDSLKETTENAKPKIVRRKVDENQRLFKLLMAGAVRKDLEITADQAGKLDNILKDLKEQVRELKANLPQQMEFGRLVQMSEEDSEKFKAVFREWSKQQKDSWAQAVAILTPSQCERLKQIQLQRFTAESLTKPGFDKSLEISEEQLLKINSCIDDHLKDRKNKWGKIGTLSPEDRHKKFFGFINEMDKAEVEENKRVLDILTSEQRKKLEKLWGKEIEVNWNYESLIKPDDLLFF